MKRFLILLAGVMMAASLAACTPTTQKDASGQTRTGAPAGVENQTTVDGKAEKLAQSGNSDEDPAITVCIYTLRTDKAGLRQTMDAVDGEELNAQLLMDKMAELEVVEEGIKVQNFELKNGVITMDLSALKDSGNKVVLAAIANTFIENYEAESLKLSVNGTAVSDADLVYTKEYKKIS